MNNPSPRFTGIFIPAEILELENLTFFEMILLSWVDALYCPQHGGCYASNEYLGEKIRGAQANTVAKALSNLRKEGLIEDVSFDGRKRVIRALIHRKVDESQKKVCIGYPSNGGWMPIQGGLDNDPSYPYIDSKVENKEEKRTSTSTSKKKKEGKTPLSSITRIAFGEYVLLKEGDYEKLCSEIGKGYVDYYIQAINNHVPNRDEGPYKDYAAVVRQWYLRAKAEGKMPNIHKVQEMTHCSSADERLTKNKQLAELAEKKLSDKFSGRVFFQSTPTHALLVHLDKDIKKEILYEAYDTPKFKEVILRELDSCFPNAKAILMGNGQNKIENLITDLSKKFKTVKANA